MSQEDLEVVRDMYEATNERDFPRAMAHYAESMEMVITDDIRAGTFKGRDAVGEWFGDWFATFDRGARFEIEEITELPGGLILLIAKHHARGRASGAQIVGEVIWLYRVSAGKVTWLRACESQAEALEVALARTHRGGPVDRRG